MSRSPLRGASLFSAGPVAGCIDMNESKRCANSRAHPSVDPQLIYWLKIATHMDQFTSNWFVEELAFLPEIIGRIPIPIRAGRCFREETRHTQGVKFGKHSNPTMASDLARLIGPIYLPLNGFRQFVLIGIVPV